MRQARAAAAAVGGVIVAWIAAVEPARADIVQVKLSGVVTSASSNLPYYSPPGIESLIGQSFTAQFVRLYEFPAQYNGFNSLLIGTANDFLSYSPSITFHASGPPLQTLTVHSRAEDRYGGDGLTVETADFTVDLPASYSGQALASLGSTAFSAYAIGTGTYALTVNDDVFNVYGRADIGFRVDTLVITNSVPEPSTWAMVLVGFAGLGYASSRRRQGPMTMLAER